MFRLRPIVAVSVVIFCMALVYAWPLLGHLKAEGVWDWPEATAHYQAAHNSIFIYKQFPLWNPYMCGGVPSLANPQSYIFSLTGLFALLFGVIEGPKIAVVLYITLGGIGVWLLAREQKVGRIASLAAVPIYLMGGFMSIHLSAGQFLWLTLAWVPWVMWFFIRSERSWWWLLGGSFMLAMIGWEGRSYLVAYVGVMLLVYGLFIDAAFGLGKRGTLRAGILILFAFLLGAWKFVPDLFFLARADSQLSNNLPIPFWQQLAMLFQRELYIDEGGRPISHVEYGSYIGWLPLILAAFALRSRSTVARMAPWLMVGFVMFAVAVSGPGTNPLELFPVLRELRNPQRAMSMVLLVVSLLAAVGVQHVVRMRVIRTRALQVLVCAAFVAALFLDFVSVSYPILTRGYPHEPDLSQPQDRPIYLDFVQDEGRPPYPTVAMNHGAKDFCAAQFAAWWPQSTIAKRSDEGYRGEVYLIDGDGSVSLHEFTPNYLLLKADVRTRAVIEVNQHYLPHWDVSVGAVGSSDQGLIAVVIPPGQHDIRLVHRPEGMWIGLSVTLVTLLCLLVLFAGRGVFGWGKVL